MKHLLIAASVLAMTAGVASADVTFSGTASAGIAQNGTKNGGAHNSGTALNTTAVNAPSITATSAYAADNKFHAYSDFDLAVAASGTTDSGLTFGATTDIHAGYTYTLGDGDGFEHKGATLASPTVFISGSFGKVSFSANNLDFYNTDVSNSGKADVQYEGTFGGLTVGLITDIESTDTAAMVAYSSGPISLSGDYNQDSTAGAKAIWDASASYTMGVFTGTVSATNDNNIVGSGGTYDTSESVKLAYASGGIGAWVKGTSAYGAKKAELALGGSYASGPMSLTVEVDDVTQANHGYYKWTVTGAYDMGNGLSLVAGANYTNDAMVGASMKF